MASTSASQSFFRSPPHTAAAEVVTLILQTAIREGAPLYNLGDLNGCNSRYIKAAQHLLVTELLSTEMRARVVQAAEMGSESGDAWILRRIFDTILADPIHAIKSRNVHMDAASGAADMEESENKMTEAAAPKIGENILASSSKLRWTVVNDSVMGGRSSSSIDQQSNGSIVFTGNLVLQGGGFCKASGRSVSSSFVSLPLSMTGFVVTAVGDGQRYKLVLRDSKSEYSWQADFVTASDGTIQTFKLPLAAFIASWRGQVMTARQPLGSQDIREVGIMLSKLTDHSFPNPQIQAGNFRVQIVAIHTY